MEIVGLGLLELNEISHTCCLKTTTCTTSSSSCTTSTTFPRNNVSKKEVSSKFTRSMMPSY